MAPVRKHPGFDKWLAREEEIQRLLDRGCGPAEIGRRFGVGGEHIGYVIKRLGLVAVLPEPIVSTLLPPERPRVIRRYVEDGVTVTVYEARTAAGALPNKFRA